MFYNDIHIALEGPFEIFALSVINIMVRLIAIWSLWVPFAYLVQKLAFTCICSTRSSEEAWIFQRNQTRWFDLQIEWGKGQNQPSCFLGYVLCASPEHGLMFSLHSLFFMNGLKIQKWHEDIHYCLTATFSTPLWDIWLVLRKFVLELRQN